MGRPSLSTSISTGTWMVRPSEVVSVRQVRTTRRSLSKDLFAWETKPWPTPATAPATLPTTAPVAPPTAVPMAGPGWRGLTMRPSS